MAPKKAAATPAAGQRSISSFFTPGAKAPSKRPDETPDTAPSDANPPATGTARATPVRVPTPLRPGTDDRAESPDNNARDVPAPAAAPSPSPPAKRPRAGGAKAQGAGKAPGAGKARGGASGGANAKEPAGPAKRPAPRRAAQRRAVVESSSDEESPSDNDDSGDSDFAASDGSSSDEEASMEGVVEESSDDSDGGSDGADSDSGSDAAPAPKRRAVGAARAAAKGNAAKGGSKSGPARKAAGRGKGKGGGGGAGASGGASGGDGVTSPSAPNPTEGMGTTAVPAATTSAALPAALPARTPLPGAASRMHQALGVAGGAVEGSLAVGLGGESAQFAARAADPKFAFLRPDKIRDAHGRRPSDPAYDPRTLAIPAGWFKEHKVADGQRQWWEFKSKHFDSVLLFKMGRFYEMFEMDAHVGVEVLGLQYMRGDQPHAGFPENNYHRHAERLARAGHRVVVVEQTETPEGLAERNRERRAKGLTADKVVRREVVAILTLATLHDPEMLHGSTDAVYLAALAEMPGKGAEGRTRIGACFVDVSTGRLLSGEWEDDELRTTLRAHLAARQVGEVVVARGEGALVAETRATVRAAVGGVRWEERGGVGAGEAVTALREGGYFADNALPPPLAALVERGREVAMCAVGLAHAHLREALLDRAVLAMGNAGGLGGEGDEGEGEGEGEGVPCHMALDGAALENLELVSNAEGTTHGTLLERLDHCATAAGRRLLREWLLRPLTRVSDIRARQDAVAALCGEGGEAMVQARRVMGKVPDLDRTLARLAAAVEGGGTGRDAAGVVLYEDAARRRVGMAAAALRGLEDLAKAVAAFDGVRGSLSSPLLRRLVTPGQGFPDLAPRLAALRQAADWETAEKEGRVVPAAGVDAACDEAAQAVEEAEGALESFLQETQRGVCRHARFVSVGSQSHLVEVPDSDTGRVPKDWELAGTRKGFRRYTCPDLADLVKALDAARRAREAALSASLAALLRRFGAEGATWRSAVRACAHLDALMSLAVHAQVGGPSMVRPVILSDSDRGPVFIARGLSHPASVRTQAGAPFVPNDIHLGGDCPPLTLLTGPNMGGKSTLLRQVCLAAVMAQAGAWVPATSLEMTPCDAVFVRMGARDRIVAGQSTFYVELAETAAVLSRASEASLVAVDELGRGTSTLDGAAIASAVLGHIAHVTRCRGLFATHYHALAEEAQARHQGRVRTMHMACRAEGGAAPGPDAVTFLYRLTEGPCPRSYGTHVARLAGLPTSVVNRAAARAAAAEAHGLAGAAAAVAEAEAGAGAAAFAGKVVAAVEAGDAEAVRRLWMAAAAAVHAE